MDLILSFILFHPETDLLAEKCALLALCPGSVRQPFRETLNRRFLVVVVRFSPR